MFKRSNESFKEKINNLLLITSFIIYIAFSIWGILFKFTYFNLVKYHYDYLDLTVVERLNRAFDITNIYDTFSLNIVLNIILFIPLGLYLPLLFKKQRPIRDILIALLLSLSFELIQLFTRLGAMDILDLITNFGGFLIGYLLFYLLRPYVKNSVINIIQIIVIMIFLPIVIYGYTNLFMHLDYYEPFFDYLKHPLLWK